MFEPVEATVIELVTPPVEDIELPVICAHCGCGHETHEHSAAIGGPSSNFVTNGSKWGDGNLGDPGGVVTWSIITSAVPDGQGGTVDPLSNFMPAGFEADLQAAFDAWEAVADIRFVRIEDGGGTERVDPVADIRIGGDTIDGANGTLAFAFFPGEFSGQNAANGDITFDSAESWKTSTAGPANGTSFFLVALHEIGHSIGLDHEDDVPAVMSTFLNDTLTGLQTDDINGAQAIYGNAGTVADPTEVTGTGNADTIVGAGTTNAIFGGAGNDSLTGGASFDVLQGGAGLESHAVHAGRDESRGPGADAPAGKGHDASA